MRLIENKVEVSMPALWIGHINITNEQAYSKYALLAGPAIKKNGGKIIARAGKYLQMEGNERTRHVVAKFSSVEKAEACYNSPEYQNALQFALGAADRDIIIVETSE
jgi:uncharacterized protein (DUF1330 family)